MRALVQRVRRGSVTIADRKTAEIDKGLVILVGVGKGDTEKEAEWLAGKCANLRVFEDDQGKMNRSLIDMRGEAIVVSQFTLYGDVSKGRRPSFIYAADPAEAAPLVNAFADHLSAQGIATQTGEFGAAMLVAIENDGPVTLMLERGPIQTEND